METKRCSICHTWQPLDNFYFTGRVSTVTGLKTRDSRCKQCKKGNCHTTNPAYQPRPEFGYQEGTPETLFLYKIRPPQ